MHKLKFAILLIISILGITSVAAQDNKANVAITLERTACFGSCPVYTITIYDNGDVVYNGQKFVDVMGEQTSQIDPATVALMVKAFETAGYFDWKEAYDTQMVTDLPSTITSVTQAGKTHRITHYAGDNTAPQALSFLELWIDDMTNSQLWTGVQRNIANVSFGSDAPVLTLQRDACYGKCPVYKVAIYADGTVVYSGIANVKAIGVSILKVDASAISGIVQKAQALGYFDWQDSYEKRVMTDQSTVTTSVQLEDQVKQIARYKGDPNAPVGLLWIEDSIDQLLTPAAS
ncbi:MAG: hypothetical protein H0X30_33650 [Anaerolineae bacterium]|nr:hypothetical protein [Anaerolineae bacterium]